MLSWLGSLLADRIGPRRTRTGSRETTGSGSDGATGTEGSSTGASDEDRPGESTDGAAARGRDDRVSAEDLLDDPPISKQEMHLELGLKPPEFIVWLVRNDGGRTWQSDLVATTGWSKSTVSRYLDGLESDGTIERVQVGRQKLVALPGEMPDTVPTSDGSPADPLAGV